MQPKSEPLRQVIAAEQIQKRVKELARHISDDYQGPDGAGACRSGERLYVYGRSCAGDGRSGGLPVHQAQIQQAASKAPGGRSVEIFFSHEPDIRGQHILLVEGLVHSGVTSEFLMNDLRARGAASVKLVTLLDRQSARRVALQPDYFGFLVDEAFLVGYGLGAAEQTNRNISYLAAIPAPQMT